MNISANEQRFMTTPFGIGAAITATVLLMAIPLFRGLSDVPIILMFSAAIFSLCFVATRVIAEKRFGLFVLVFIFYHIFFLILPGSLHIARGYFPFYGMRYSEAVVFQASAIVSIWCVGYAVGFAWHARKDQIVGLRQGVVLSNTKYATGAIMAYAVVLMAIALTLVLQNGLEMFTTRRLVDGAEAFDTRSVSSQIIFNIVRLSTFTAAMLSLVIARREKTAVAIALAAIAVPFFILVNPINGIPRYYLFGYIFAFAFVFVDFSVSWKKMIFLGGLIFGLFILFPLANFISRGTERDLLSFNPVEYYAESGDYDGLQSVANVANIVEADGLSYGYQLLGVPLAIVPRSSWPAKPVPTGEWAAKKNGYRYTNISSPIASEVFIDFWWGGIIILSIGFGYFSSWLDILSVRKRREQDLWLPALLGILVGFETIVLRGSLMGASTPVGLAIVLMAIPGLMRMKKTTPARPAGIRIQSDEQTNRTGRQRVLALQKGADSTSSVN
jgi:hypothetical protein